MADDQQQPAWARAFARDRETIGAAWRAISEDGRRWAFGIDEIIRVSYRLGYEARAREEEGRDGAN